MRDSLLEAGSKNPEAGSRKQEVRIAKTGEKRDKRGSEGRRK